MMPARVGVTALALVLAACSGPDLSAGYRYSCSRTATDQAAECPGGWVCTLDGVCANPAKGEPFTCGVDTDCTGGWHCGPAQRCYDRADAGAVACRASVPKDCAEGWRCTLDAVCADSNGPGPWTCASDTDCTGGWHCGPSQKCYDRAVAGAVACRATVPADCADGWRCGLNGTCHSRDAGAAYACRDDGDCERGWRCGFDGTCIDAADDGLRATSDAGTPGSTLVSPSVLQGAVDLAAVSNEVTTDPCGQPTPARLVTAFVADGGVTVVTTTHALDGGLLYAGGVCAAGVVDQVRQQVARGPVGSAGPLQELVALPGRAVGLSDGGVLTRFTVTGSTLTSAPVPLPFSPTRLRHTGNTLQRWVAFNTQSFAIEELGSAPITTQQLSIDSPSGVRTPTLFDVATVDWNGDVMSWFMASSVGLWAATTPVRSLVPGPGPTPAPSSWTLLSVPGWAAPCGGTPPTWARLAVTPEPMNQPYTFALAAALRRPGVFGDEDQVEVFALVPNADGTQSCVLGGTVYGGTLFPPGFNLGLDQPHEASPAGVRFIFETCVPCGSRPLVDLAIAPSPYRTADRPQQQTWDLEARCADGRGGTTVVTWNASRCPNPTRTSPAVAGAAPYAPGLTRSTSNPQHRVVVGGHGETWLEVTDNQLALAPTSLDAPPDVVTGVADSLLATRPPLSGDPFDRLFVVPDPIVGGALVDLDPRTGVSISLPTDVHLVSGVEGQPSWVVKRTSSLPGYPDNFVVLSRPSRDPASWGALAVLSPPTQLGANVRASTTLPADGGVTLLVAVDDALYAADVTATVTTPIPPALAGTANTPNLLLAAIPLPRVGITSLVGLPADPVASHLARYGEAWAIAAGRVFRVAADNPLLWRTTEEVLEPTPATRVWADGRRVRVGYGDGTVYSLPSRVLVAPAIAPNQSVVVDYAGLCRQSFALTTQGLYRLAVDADNSSGHWERLALQSDGAQSPGYAGGKLWAAHDALYVFLPHGWVEKVSGFTCP